MIQPLATALLICIAASAAAQAEGVYIPQIPPDAKFDDKAAIKSNIEPLPLKDTNQREDLARILSNQRLSEYARANAAIGFAGTAPAEESPAQDESIAEASEPAVRTGAKPALPQGTPNSDVRIPQVPPQGKPKPKKSKAADK